MYFKQIFRASAHHEGKVSEIQWRPGSNKRRQQGASPNLSKDEIFVQEAKQSSRMLCGAVSFQTALKPLTTGVSPETTLAKNSYCSPKHLALAGFGDLVRVCGINLQSFTGNFEVTGQTCSFVKLFNFVPSSTKTHKNLVCGNQSPNLINCEHKVHLEKKVKAMKLGASKGWFMYP